MDQTSQREKSPAALSGTIEAIPLFDLCQFLLLNRRTGTLTVKKESATVRIFYEEGMILDITDDALRSGEKVLLGAVQWTKGTFSFDPTPPGIERKIQGSTEAILLDAARTIDEYRATTGDDSTGPTQETIFRERLSFAGELAEAFHNAIEPAEIDSSSTDPFQNLLTDLQRTRSTLLLRGRSGIMRAADGIRPYTAKMEPDDLLQRLQIPIPRGGEVVNHRFEKPPGWFHLRCHRVGGELQLLLANLLSELPRPQEIGIDPVAFDTLLAQEGGLILWSGVPRGLRSHALACWLGHSNGSSRGLTLWLEERPRVAWEVACWISRHVGDPDSVGSISGLLEWNPDLVVIDPVRTERAAVLALEMAESGTTTVAVSTGLTIRDAIETYHSILIRAGVSRAGSRLGKVLSGWVGILPLAEDEGVQSLVATQVVTTDRGLEALLSEDRTSEEFEEWAKGCIPTRSYGEECERLEREGRITKGTRARLQRDLSIPGL